MSYDCEKDGLSVGELLADLRFRIPLFGKPKPGQILYRIASLKPFRTKEVKFYPGFGVLPEEEFLKLLVKRQEECKKRKGSVSEKNQNEVEAAGVVGEVYTTQTGMDIADPEVHTNGWKQETPAKRVRVEACDVGMHQRWWVWRTIQQETTETTNRKET